METDSPSELQYQKPRRFLIQMSGAPGSGKSTLANLIATKIDAVVINHDLIRSFFLDKKSSSEQAARLTYSFQWVLAEDMINQGRSVVIDSTCNFPEVIAQGQALAVKHSLVYKYVECKIKDIQLLDQRLSERSSTALRSQRTGVENPPQDVETSHVEGGNQALFMKWMQHPCRPSDSDMIIVDSTASPTECLEYVLAGIK